MAAGVTPAILRCLLHVAGQFRCKTGRRRPVLDAELWINVFEMFSDRCHRYSEDCCNLTVRLAATDPKQHLALAWRETVMLAGPSFAILSNQL